MGSKKLDWKEVADFARASGVTAKELYDYTINKLRIKIKPETIKIGCLVYDALQKKDKHKPRAKIIHLRKSIELINPKYKRFSDQQLYENAYHALKRTPGFVKFDKKVRKQIF